MTFSLKYLLTISLFLCGNSSFASQELAIPLEDPAIQSSTIENSQITLNNSLPVRISLAAEDSWPPFADQYGKGVSHQLIHAAFEQVGITVDTILVPYSRGLKMASEGSVDGVFNVAKLKQRQDDYRFGEQALFISHSLFFHSKSRPMLAKSKSQLTSGTRIGKVKGFYYGGEIDTLNQVEFVDVDNQYQLINLLLTGKIDGALMYQEVAQRYIQQMKVSDDIIPAFDNQQNMIFLAFSKQTPHSQRLASVFDLGLKKLKNNGSYQQIISGYAQAAP